MYNKAHNSDSKILFCQGISIHGALIRILLLKKTVHYAHFESLFDNIFLGHYIRLSADDVVNSRPS